MLSAYLSGSVGWFGCLCRRKSGPNHIELYPEGLFYCNITAYCARSRLFDAERRIYLEYWNHFNLRNSGHTLLLNGDWCWALVSLESWLDERSS